jgi:hypothetical protein
MWQHRRRSIITYTWTVDTEKPVLATEAKSGDLGCNPTVEAPVFTGTDNCEGTIVPVVSTNGPTNVGCSYSQTWTANYTDACGNPAEEISITYTWTVDNDAPVLATEAKSGDLGCNPTVKAPEFTGTDNCEGTIVPVVSTNGPTNVGCSYSQTWTANYTDACGNPAEEVSITYTWTVDTDAPVLATEAKSGDLGCNPTVEAPVFTGTDNCEGTIVPVVSTNGPTNVGCAYTQTWTASYTDACGNPAEEISITYTWTVDTDAPVLATEAKSGDLGCNPTVEAPVFTGTDNCEGTIVPVVSTNGPTNVGCAYTQTWTASYTDACGNPAEEVSITYTWTVDTEKPVLATEAKSGDLGCNPTVNAPVFTGTDNCEGTIVPVVSTNGPTNVGCSYSQTWTANYTDACGNPAEEVSITYTWTVDTEKPVLATEAKSGDLGCMLDEIIAPEFTGTDNCEGIILPKVSTDGPTNVGCLYTQTWTASYTDGCGNEAKEISITYTWTHSTKAPVITTLAVSGDLGCNPEVVAPVFTGTDNCEGVIVPEVSTQGPISGACAFYQTWTATYVDKCGNAAEPVSITYTWIEDREEPTFLNVPEDLKLTCINDVPEAISLTWVDNCVGQGIVDAIEETEGDACSKIITRTWTITDACGNKATAKQVITVKDNIDPIFEAAPADASYDCIAEVPVAKELKWTDNCDGEGYAPVKEEVVGSACDMVLTRTWIYTDNCGNVAKAVQTIRVKDESKPEFENAPANANYECISEVPAPGKLTWKDNCDGTGEVDGVDVSDGLSCPETITRTWSYTDACGNEGSVSQIIKIQDITRPELTMQKADLKLDCYNYDIIKLWADSVTAIDNCDGKLAVNYVIDEPVTSCAITLEVEFWAVDACGNKVSVTKMLYINDDVNPIFTSVPKDVNLGCNPTEEAIEEALGSAIADDNCSKVDVTFSDSQVLVEGCIRSITRTFVATDVCENKAEASVTVSWTEDLTIPIIIADKKDANLYCNPSEAEIDAALGGAKGEDGCGIVELSFVDMSGSEGCSFWKTRTFSAADGCGNEAIPVSVTVIWTVDTEAPVIVADNKDAFLGCNPDQALIEAALGSATVSDNCDANVVVQRIDSELIVDGCTQSYIRTFTAIDVCGNEALPVSVKVSWTADVDAPVFTWVAQNANLGCNPRAEDIEAALGKAKAEDTCVGDVEVSHMDSEVLIDGCIRMVTRTFTATDGCDNAAKASVTVSWTEDKDAPVLTLTGTNVDLGCNPSRADIETALGTATAKDACYEVEIRKADVAGNSQGCYQSITRIFTAIDGCNNKSEASVTVTWKADLQAPALNQTLSDLVFKCQEPVILPDAKFVDNCDASVNTILTINGQVVTDTENYLFEAGTYEVCYSATDECGNSDSKCITVTVDNCPQLYCTLTQGFYGNTGGKYCDGRTTTQLLTDLLDNDLKVGCSGHSYTVGQGNADCVIKLLPFSGPSAMLDKDYFCGTQPKGNTLLGQVLTLGLNLRLDAELADLTITPFYVNGAYRFWTAESSSCKVEDGDAVPVGDWKEFVLPASVLNANGSVNVLDLYNMANAALCSGGSKAWLGDLTAAVGAINDGFDECRFLSIVPIESNEELGETDGCGYLKVYPNPFVNDLTFEFIHCEDTYATIEIYDMYGKKVATLMDNQWISKNHTYKEAFDGSLFRKGSYFYRLTLENKVLTGKVIRK